jgi:hypothetical protein
MSEPTDDDIERGLRDYIADYIDLEHRLSALIGEAMARQTDDHAASMLRRAAKWILRPLGDGTAQLVLAFDDDAADLGARRAATWDGEPEQPPEPGSAEHAEVFVAADSRSACWRA